jgi:hypothetical protein
VRLVDWQPNLDKRLARNAEQIRTKKGQTIGWCGRRELADAEARRAIRSGYVNVHVYSVVDHPPYFVGQEVA